jgi:hypothetical protein
VVLLVTSVLVKLPLVDSYQLNAVPSEALIRHNLFGKDHGLLFWLLNLQEVVILLDELVCAK